MLNHIVLMGRLTRDVELRYTQSQLPVASFTLAVDRDFALQDGSRETDFIDCVAWRGTAEFASKWFSKGKMAVVSGRLQIRDWTDREGGKRRSAEIVVDNLYFGEPKRDGDGGGQRGDYAQRGGGGQQRSGSYASRPASGSYPASDYGDPGAGGGGFSELEDTDGELPF